MKVSQILRSIKTTPELWTIKHHNAVLVAFTYQGFTFAKLTNDYGSGIKLVNKQAGVEMVWNSDDPVASQLWSSVIMHYVNTHIISK